MRLHRPVLAGLALGAVVLPVTAANAATGVAAAGSALSTATIANVSVGALLDIVEAQDVAVGTLSSAAQTVTSSAPAVSFTPITLNGVKTGAVTVTPANSPQTVGGVSTGDLAVLSATSPGATLTAKDGAAPSSALTSTLGSISLLGLPVTLDGGLDVGSVSDASHAQAGKSLSIENVSLPNLADLLAALGIDITALPADTLNALISQLQLTINLATQQAMDGANTAVDTATQTLEDGQTAVADATTALAAATAALDAALSGASLPVGVTGPLDSTAWDALDQTTKDAIVALNTGLDTIVATYEGAQDDLDTATGAIAGLQDALDSALDTLAGIVEGVLAGVPLVKIGAADIATKAAVGATKSATVTGSISGVEVLGTDVLAAVTGNSTVDAAKLLGDLADDVTAELNTVTAALTSALSTATGLAVPAPKVELMKKTTTTGTDGAYGTAKTTLTALSISLASATIPDAFALAGAPDLPGLAPVTDGFATAPLSVKVGTLVESARFRAATTTTPQTPTTGNSHPATGAPEGLAIVAVIGTALAVGARRLRSATE